MQKNTFRAGLLCASALVAATPAYADEAEGASDDNAIVVTATRRATSIQDTPINITAMSAEELAEARVDDFTDLSDFTPGMTVQDTGPRSAGKIVLRGLNANDGSTFGSNGDNSLATYLGEVPLYFDFKFIDMERVEVLLGPQGTLYGQGTLAGAIRYIPQRPNPDFVEGYVHGRGYTLAHSQDPGFSVDGSLNVPIVPGLLALRSAVGYYDLPGFIDYPLVVKEPGVSLPQPGGVALGGASAPGLYTSNDVLGTAQEQADNFSPVKDANFERTLTMRHQLGFYPAEGVRIYLTYARQKTQTDGRQINGAGVLGTGKYEAPQRYIEPSTRKAELYAAEAEIELFGIAELVSATAWTDVGAKSQGDVTDLLLDLDYDYELFPSFAGFTDSRQTRKQFNQEIRLVSIHGGPVSWVIGGFYNDFDYTSNYKEMLPGYPDWAGFSRPDNVEYASYVISETKEKAVFGEITVEPTEGLQLTGGVRYFQYTAYIDGGSALPFFQTYPDINYRGRSGETKDDGMVWKANASYNFSPDLMVYGTYSKGYRIGGVNRVAPCLLPLPPGQNLCALPDELSFGPDKTTNKEIGFRFRLFDDKLQGSIAGYHIGWDGIQLAGQTVNGAIGITVNGGTAVSKGVELSLAVEPVDNLVIRGTYSYNDAHLTQDVIGLLQERDPVTGAPSKVDVLAGDRLPGSTKNSGSLAATYTIPMGMNDLILNWTAVLRGDILSRVGARAGGEAIPGFTTHRASIKYQTENWDVSLFVDNIFDTYAYTGVGEDLTRSFVNDGAVSRYYSRSVLTPRKIGLEATYHF